MRKQDRQGARTPAELDRRYNVKQAMQTANNALAGASKAEQAAAKASQSSASAISGVNEKVDKKDNAQIIAMINRAQEVISLLGNRLVVESSNFTLTETGEATMSKANIRSSRQKAIDSEEEVATEIKDGTIVLEPAVSSEGEFISFELLRFKYDDKTYGLYMSAYWQEATTGLQLTFSNFRINLIEG